MCQEKASAQKSATTTAAKKEAIELKGVNLGLHLFFESVKRIKNI